jgi:DNA-binding FadR family transcriptional regulator
MLLKDILQKEEGAFLGSEDELVAKLGVSRPTFRQAARLLEYQQVLRIRRGWHGGFFGARPDTAGVARIAAVVLRARGVKASQSIRMMAMLRMDSARMACACEDEQLRARLVDFQVELEMLAPQNALRQHIEFCSLVAEMSGDPTISMFTEVLLAYALVPHADTVHVNPKRAEDCLLHDRELAAAILARNAEAACRAVESHVERLESWSTEAEAEAETPTGTTRTRDPKRT